MGLYQVNKSELVKYHKRVMSVIKMLPQVTFEKVSRASNGRADALARVAKELSEPGQQDISIVVKNREPLTIESQTQEEVQESQQEIEVMSINVNTEEDWREPLIKYFTQGVQALPEEKSFREQIRKRALHFAYVNDTIYRHSANAMWLRCVYDKEAKQITSEIHEGLCGAHESEPKMYLRIKRMGYYWPTMVADCLRVDKTCRMCQLHSPYIHQAPNPLHPTIASWPFDAWGTDIVGPIEPLASNGDRFILAFTDYFSKWAEA